MNFSVSAYTRAIKEHSDALARLAPAVMDRPVEHCPDWTVADLVRHLVEVHWFWATIVDQRLSAPYEGARPAEVELSELVAQFLLGADHLVRVLQSALPEDHVWTWAPTHNNVGFVTRHQVQEIAVHHWDVAHAAGEDFVMSSELACDAISEFLTVSVSSLDDPADPPRPSLAGSLGLWCTDERRGWTISDASSAGTVLFRDGLEPGIPTLSTTSRDLLLWLYSRVDVASDSEARALGERLRALSFTS